jgi:hypothetical protein
MSLESHVLQFHVSIQRTSPPFLLHNEEPKCIECLQGLPLRPGSDVFTVTVQVVALSFWNSLSYFKFSFRGFHLPMIRKNRVRDWYALYCLLLHWVSFDIRTRNYSDFTFTSHSDIFWTSRPSVRYNICLVSGLAHIARLTIKVYEITAKR